MLKFFRYCLVLVSLVIALTGQAALELELTQGVDSAMPIAVLPFAETHNTRSLDISALIAKDLQNSGRFRTPDLSSLTLVPHSADGLDRSAWQKQGVNAVALGQLRVLSNGQYQVDFSLIDLFSSNNSVLIQQSFTTSATGLRALGHHIADLIYEKLLGQRGIFSTKIAYVLITSTGSSKFYQLQVSDYDGVNAHTVYQSTQPIMSPAWSPDGKYLAYVTFSKGRSMIYANTLATGERRLISSQQGVNGAPAWSPDGKSMALVLSSLSSPHLNLYLKTLNGNRQALTQDNSINTEPAFSPDGKSLLFTSDRGGSPQIYQIDLSGNNLRRITYNGAYNARASFTPNGQQIVMLHRDSGTYSIAIQDVKTGALQVLSESAYAQSPSIAPNGAMVVFSTRANNGNGPFVLGMVSTDGKIQIILPAGGGDVMEPAWSPF